MIQPLTATPKYSIINYRAHGNQMIITTPYIIEDGGILQTGIPYTYWEDYPPPDYKRKQFIRFTFGNRQETLQKEN